MAPGKWGLASESSWVCLRGAEHPPLELNLVIFTELVPSVFSLRFPWKISLFASCRSCWACSARLHLSPPGQTPELPNVRISVWSPNNTTHRSELQLWLNLVGFLPSFHLLRTLFRRAAVKGAVRKGQCWSSSQWGGRAPAASLGSSGALLALPREFAEQLHPGAVCKWSSNPRQFGG